MPLEPTGKVTCCMERQHILIQTKEEPISSPTVVLPFTYFMILQVLISIDFILQCLYINAPSAYSCLYLTSVLIILFLNYRKFFLSANLSAFYVSSVYLLQQPLTNYAVPYILLLLFLVDF